MTLNEAIEQATSQVGLVSATNATRQAMSLSINIDTLDEVRSATTNIGSGANIYEAIDQFTK